MAGGFQFAYVTRVMAAPPIIRSQFGAKAWDFIFGIFSISGAPLITYWLISEFSAWPCNLIYRHYGDRPASQLQILIVTLAMVAAIAAFIVVTFWRSRHRLLPAWVIVFEIFLAMVLGFFFFAFIGLCYGPNDDWNH